MNNNMKIAAVTTAAIVVILVATMLFVTPSHNDDLDDDPTYVMIDNEYSAGIQTLTLRLPEPMLKENVTTNDVEVYFASFEPYVKNHDESDFDSFWTATDSLRETIIYLNQSADVSEYAADYKIVKATQKMLKVSFEDDYQYGLFIIVVKGGSTVSGEDIREFTTDLPSMEREGGDDEGIASVSYEKDGESLKFIALTVDELEDFLDNLTGDAIIDINQDIQLSSSLSIEVGDDIMNLTMNLNGHAISTDWDTLTLFDIEGGNVTINGGDTSVHHDFKSAFYLKNFTKYREDIWTNGGTLAWMEILIDGGTFTANDVSFTLSDRNNKGSVIDAEDCVLTLKNCYIGSAISTGGAINLEDDVTLYLDGTTMNRNICSDGGAIYVNGDDVNIIGSNGSNFDYNNSFDTIMLDTIQNNNGGAIYVNGDNCYISGLKFLNNVASVYGGAIYVDNKGCTITDCEFSKNKAYEDAIVYLNASYCSVKNCSFTDNICYSGVVYVDGKHCSVTNCTFKDNDCTARGTISLTYYSFDDETKTNLDGCVFENNKAPEGAIYCWNSWNGNDQGDQWTGTVTVNGEKRTPQTEA